MALALGIATVVPLAIVVVAILAVSLASRGKKLKCPNCGTVFSAPAMDAKRSVVGWTLPYMGKVRCPNCGESRSRRDYQEAPHQTRPTT